MLHIIRITNYHHKAFLLFICICGCFLLISEVKLLPVKNKTPSTQQQANHDDHSKNKHGDHNGDHDYNVHHSLPLCEELMQRPFSPFTSGSFLTRKSTEVVWKIRKDDSRELILPHTCVLKRYTAHEAGQCLADKNLFFIGDSVTRYQFLSFAYFRA